MFIFKGGCYGLRTSTCTTLTLCQLHYVYMYLREDVVQIAYAPLEVSAVGTREAAGRSCTPMHDQVMVQSQHGTYNDLELLRRG